MPSPSQEVPLGRLQPISPRSCSQCKTAFRPHPRLRERQRTCGRENCRRQHRARYQRKYRQANPQLEVDARAKTKASRPPDFWKAFRENHEASSARNRRMTLIRMRLLRQGLQRKLDIVQVLVPPGLFQRFETFATEHRSLLLSLVA